MNPTLTEQKRYTTIRPTQKTASLYGAETLSGRQLVLVDDTAETIPAQNPRVDGC